MATRSRKRMQNQQEDSNKETSRSADPEKDSRSESSKKARMTKTKTREQKDEGKRNGTGEAPLLSARPEHRTHVPPKPIGESGDNDILEAPPLNTADTTDRCAGYVDLNLWDLDNPPKGEAYRSLKPEKLANVEVLYIKRPTAWKYNLTAYVEKGQIGIPPAANLETVIKTLLLKSKENSLFGSLFLLGGNHSLCAMKKQILAHHPELEQYFKVHVMIYVDLSELERHTLANSDNVCALQPICSTDWLRLARKHAVEQLKWQAGSENYDVEKPIPVTPQTLKAIYSYLVSIYEDTTDQEKTANFKRCIGLALVADADHSILEEAFTHFESAKGQTGSTTLCGGTIIVQDMGPTVCARILNYQLGAKTYARDLKLVGKLLRDFKASDWDFDAVFPKTVKKHPEGHPRKDAEGNVIGTLGFKRRATTGEMLDLPVMDQVEHQEVVRVVSPEIFPQDRNKTDHSSISLGVQKPLLSPIREEAMDEEANVNSAGTGNMLEPSNVIESIKLFTDQKILMTDQRPVEDAQMTNENAPGTNVDPLVILAAKTETAKTETAKTETAKTETAKTETAKPAAVVDKNRKIVVGMKVSIPRDQDVMEIARAKAEERKADGFWIAGGFGTLESLTVIHPANQVGKIYRNVLVANIATKADNERGIITFSTGDELARVMYLHGPAIAGEDFTIDLQLHTTRKE